MQGQPCSDRSGSLGRHFASTNISSYWRGKSHDWLISLSAGVSMLTLYGSMRVAISSKMIEKLYSNTSITESFSSYSPSYIPVHISGWRHLQGTIMSMALHFWRAIDVRQLLPHLHSFLTISQIVLIAKRWQTKIYKAHKNDLYRQQ